MFTRAETADYIASISEDLSRMAVAAGLDQLAYILAMAALESRGRDSEHVQSDKKAA